MPHIGQGVFFSANFGDYRTNYTGLMKVEGGMGMGNRDNDQVQHSLREQGAEESVGAVFYQEADEYTAGLATTQELVSDMYKMGTIEDKTR